MEGLADEAEIGDLVAQTLSLLGEEGEADALELHKSQSNGREASGLYQTDPLSSAGENEVSLSPHEAHGTGMGEMQNVALEAATEISQGAVEIPRMEQLEPVEEAGLPADDESREGFVRASTGAYEGGSNVAIRIWVKDAEKAESTTALGLKSTHFVYEVRMQSSLPGLVSDGTMSVRRRFSEFDALHRMLHVEFRGCFIPPLPQKSFIEHKTYAANNQEFLRLRRADLQAFLRAIMSHSLLRQSDAMKVFLLQPGELVHNPAWIQLQAATAAAKKPASSPSKEAAADSPAAAQRPPGTQGGVALANIGNWMNWVKHNTLAVFQPPKRVLSTDELDLRQAKELLQDLERLMQLTTTSARSLCNNMERMASDFHEFGRNMGMLSKFEEAVQARAGAYTPEGHSASVRAADCKKMAMTQAKQSGVWKAASLKSAANLVVLHDLYIMIPEAIAAMEEREAALDHVFSLEEDLAHKRHQLEQLQAAGSGGKGGLLGLNSAAVGNAEKRSFLLSQSIAVLTDQIRQQREQYELIKARNKSELTRMGLEREADFKRMMSAFAATQAALVQSSASMWASLSKQLEEESLPATAPKA